jgi:hypothetical protein
VSGLTDSWKAGRILRLNLFFSETVNDRFAKEMKVERTPTYILFDAQGEEVKRWVDKAPALADLPAQ